MMDMNQAVPAIGGLDWGALRSLEPASDRWGTVIAMGSPTNNLASMEEFLLRVQHIGPEQEFPVREGMTIGRNPTNNVMIVHPDVKPFHAVVLRNQAGNWLVRCKLQDTLLYTAAGAPRNEITLADGLEFHLGPARITCHASADRQAMTALEKLAAALRCRRCNHDLAAIQQLARFCPQCGMELEIFPAQQPGNISGSELADLNTWLEQVYANRQSGGNAHEHPPAILAYVNTMFNLGWRYENGRGVLRNVEEALRYYRRAANMGNQSALRRLGE